MEECDHSIPNKIFSFLDDPFPQLSQTFNLFTAFETSCEPVQSNEYGKGKNRESDRSKIDEELFRFKSNGIKSWKERVIDKSIDRLVQVVYLCVVKSYDLEYSGQDQINIAWHIAVEQCFMGRQPQGVDHFKEHLLSKTEDVVNQTKSNS